ncbi:hypothetical protein GIB67_020648 [Kingdonia uniflora]|uniref:Uncharacterized protein n=1 Tax=Kingdonia uniflora TaxID=39325 RepID=A0A7J7M9I0_9MAGN|nr:hypothetical protein GIB67_020648 [Kingdonia uniflora]
MQAILMMDYRKGLAYASDAVITSIIISLTTPVVNGSGLTLPTMPILGLAPLGQASNPSLAGLLGTCLSIPALNVPSKCLLLKKMFKRFTYLSRLLETRNGFIHAGMSHQDPSLY